MLILFSINLVKLIDRHGSHSCILLVDGGSIRKCLTWRPLINSCTLNCSCMAYAYADLSSAWGTMDWATHRGVRTAWRSPASLELVHPACLISWYARSTTPHLSIPGAGSNICAQCEYVTVIHVICRHRSKACLWDANRMELECSKMFLDLVQICQIKYAEADLLFLNKLCILKKKFKFARVTSDFCSSKLSICMYPDWT